ncbi:hypothetical protein [Shewanella sp. 10N.286.54.B9]
MPNSVWNRIGLMDSTKSPIFENLSRINSGLDKHSHSAIEFSI